MPTCTRGSRELKNLISHNNEGNVEMKDNGTVENAAQENGKKKRKVTKVENEQLASVAGLPSSPIDVDKRENDKRDTGSDMGNTTAQLSITKETTNTTSECRFTIDANKVMTKLLQNYSKRAVGVMADVHNKQVTELEEDAMFRKMSLDGLTKENKTQKLLLEEKEKHITKLIEDTALQTNENECLHSTNTDQNNRVSELEADNRRLMEEYDLHTNEIERLHSAITDQNNRMSELEADNRRLNVQFNNIVQIVNPTGNDDPSSLSNPTVINTTDS